MKKILLATMFAFATICLHAQNLYVQPITGEQIVFAIVENPRITFGSGTMTIQQTTFQLNDIQNLSFVKNVTTNIVWGGQTPPLHVFPNPVTNQLHIVHN